MIRKINKVMALILIAATVSTIAPVGSIKAQAAVDDNSKINISQQTNNVTLDSIDPTAMIGAMIPDGNTAISLADQNLDAGVNMVFHAQDGTISSVTNAQCGKLSYTISDTMANGISTQVLAAFKAQITQQIMDGLAAEGITTIPDTVISPMVENKIKDALTPSAIKSSFQNIPVYQYTGKDASGNVKEQAFVIRGLVGVIVNSAMSQGYITDTYNAKVRNAAYSGVSPVPSLAFNPSTGTTAYNAAINLGSGAQVIGDGMSINVVDSINNKVYVINNPVYNMMKAQAGKAGDIDKQLNIIDFSGVSNLKGSLSSPMDVSGTDFSILSLSLTANDGTLTNNKNYQYALVVGDYEKNLLDSKISAMGFPTSTATMIENMIESNRYLMIPNVSSEAGSAIDNVIDKSGIGKNINNITDGMNNLSDALNDLTDALKKKNDDVDDAWDKVFDRFDNSQGWGKRDGYTYYYDKDGVSKKGVQTINGKTYYFNRIDGAMETGWQIVDGKRCYFDKNKGYEVNNQWVQDGDDWYFVGDDGVVKKMQWANAGGKNYYLKADGKMTKGWLKIDDYWYCFNKDGSMVTATWEWSDGKWYYLKDNGQAAVGWLQLGEDYYYFKDPTGQLQTGWFRADGNWYCSNDDGSMKTGWVSSKDSWCYLDDNTGKMKKNEWVTIDGKSYYFNIDGAMVTGSKYIDGTKYVFNSDGTLND